MRLGIETRSARADRELRLLELSFQYGFLKGRAQAGEMTDIDRRRLDELRPTFEGDGPIRTRRKYRRYPTYLPVVVCGATGEGHGILLNFSSGGLFLATHQTFPEGTDLQVKVGRPGEVEFLYSCQVTRKLRGNWINGVACRLSGPPMELRPSREDN